MRKLIFAALLLVSFGAATTASTHPAAAAGAPAAREYSPSLFEIDDFSFDIEQ